MKCLKRRITSQRRLVMSFNLDVSQKYPNSDKVASANLKIEKLYPLQQLQTFMGYLSFDGLYCDLTQSQVS